MAGEPIQRLVVIRRGGSRPRRDGAVAQRQSGVRHDEIGVDRLLGAEPVAFRAGAERIVEREQPRFDFSDGEAGHRARELFGEEEALRRGFLVLGGGESAMAMPSAMPSAVSSESASRAPISGRTTMRSTTTSMSCFSFLSRDRGPRNLEKRAVDLRRAGKPFFWNSAISLRYSPLRPRTTGASK
jgi:hypothetical protein